MLFLNCALLTNCHSYASLMLLQLRMSKKIAQLTKVIYHLNSKNEDHDMDLQELAEQYETEIEQILRDTSDKINTFKSQLDAASDQARIAELTKVQTADAFREPNCHAEP